MWKWFTAKVHCKLWLCKYTLDVSTAAHWCVKREASRGAKWKLWDDGDMFVSTAAFQMAKIHVQNITYMTSVHGDALPGTCVEYSSGAEATGSRESHGQKERWLLCMAYLAKLEPCSVAWRILPLGGLYICSVSIIAVVLLNITIPFTYNDQIYFINYISIYMMLLFMSYAACWKLSGNMKLS